MRARLCFRIVKTFDGSTPRPINTRHLDIWTKGNNFKFELATEPDSQPNNNVNLRQLESFKQEDIINFANASEARYPSECYKAKSLLLREGIPSKAATEERLLTVTEGELAGMGDFKLGEKVCVACYVWTQIYTKIGNLEFPVDQVPCLKDWYPNETLEQVTSDWRTVTPKLYFHTDEIAISDLPARFSSSPPALDLAYKYNSLEIPDPRFNYNANDWISRQVNGATAVDAAANDSTKQILNNNSGRDGDIFMSVSDRGYMQSPGELGYIIRFFNYTPIGVSASGAELVNQTKVPEINDANYASLIVNNTDWEAMFRTFRLYDHGDVDPKYGGVLPKDDVYGRFYVMKEDETLPGAHVNPLSDIPDVLDAAIWDTPLDYWFAATNTPPSKKKGQTFNRRAFHFAQGNKGDKLAVSDPDLTAKRWTNFLDEWSDALEKAVTQPWEVNGRQVKVNSEWRSSLSDVYGDWDVFKWYSGKNDRREIFGIDNLLENELHEVDRKMLFSHSLDAFSDRQQLFLLFLRAEATVPSFGGVSEGGMRSLAGGRAVALVWRDPYPRDYDKAADIAGDVNKQWAKRSGNQAWYPNNNDDSPWLQYPNHSNSARWDGYHETRILFFKQLDQ